MEKVFKFLFVVIISSIPALLNRSVQIRMNWTITLFFTIFYQFVYLLYSLSFSMRITPNISDFFHHISIAEKNDSREAGNKLIFSASGFLFLRNNAPARELDVCRPSVFTNLFFIQTYFKHIKIFPQAWTKLLIANEIRNK